MSVMNEAGHLLCAMPFPEPKQVIERIRHRFPRLKVTYTSSRLNVDWENGIVLPEGMNVPLYDYTSGADNCPIETWKDVTILCTLSQFPPDPSLAPALELVHVISAGTNHIWNLPIYNNSQVPITTSSGMHGPTIAEWVIMTSLVASRKYNILRERQIEHSWDESKGGRTIFNSASDNVGKRLGILGYGSIGRQVGKIAKAMGMDVVVFTAFPRNTPESKRDHGYVVPGTGDPKGEVPSAWYSGHDKASLHNFLGQGLDQLLISVPLTNTTKHMLGKKEFEILERRNTFIINVARGDIIIQEDLIEALKLFENDALVAADGTRRGLRGAALDVTTPEPLDKDHPLWDAPNCIVTPHMSGLSQDYSRRALEVLETNLERKAKGLSLINLVNREQGYSSKISL